MAALPHSSDSSASDSTGGVERYQLENGLTVLLKPQHGSPVVAVQAWVGVGSADEPDEMAGVSHVFEHMLFKGTARRGVGRIAREVEAAGGEINAWTSFDQTVLSRGAGEPLLRRRRRHPDRRAAQLVLRSGGAAA